jgi:hypothetical protein
MLLELPFPPNISALDIYPLRHTNIRMSRSPNAFFFYREACSNQLKLQNHNLKMVEVSRLVSENWKNEPTFVKDEYRKIARVARELSKRKSYYESLRIITKLSGNKVIDDFVRYTQINYEPGGELEFVPYDQFKNIEFIVEGGFSKIYKATWVDGPINNWDKIKRNGGKIFRNKSNKNKTVVLKKLNNSENITSKELNEV